MTCTHVKTIRTMRDEGKGRSMSGSRQPQEHLDKWLFSFQA